MQPPTTSKIEAELPAQTSFAPQPLFRFLVTSEVILPVSASTLWKRLTDFENYHAWNTFTPKVRTTLIEGAPVHLEVHGLDKRPLSRLEFMHSIVNERRLCWGMRMGPLLTASRAQYVYPLSDTQTLYRTEDLLSGLLTPLVRVLYGKKMQLGFKRVSQGLVASFNDERSVARKKP